MEKTVNSFPENMRFEDKVIMGLIHERETKMAEETYSVTEVMQAEDLQKRCPILKDTSLVDIVRVNRANDETGHRFRTYSPDSEPLF